MPTASPPTRTILSRARGDSPCSAADSEERFKKVGWYLIPNPYEPLSGNDKYHFNNDKDWEGNNESSRTRMDRSACRLARDRAAPYPPIIPKARSGDEGCRTL